MLEFYFPCQTHKHREHTSTLIADSQLMFSHHTDRLIVQTWSLVIICIDSICLHCVVIAVLVVT